MRLLRFFILIGCITALLLPTAADAARTKRQRGSKASSAETGVNDSRYAAVIIDPVTGEVFHQKDATQRRYPASLTKMMTLYLLFEALDAKKISLHTRMDVSDLAASQPQTNLALSAGDEIPVETAIKALVVRSANDVAVVVAETLGGDVNGFAKMMTQKARVLGMSNTVFVNPHGLPNSNQYTTAHDMAKLGIALKRDFPRYFPYFSVRQFSWEGTSYYTHNRVMLRYAGVDGIKTGYIGASGFNLVTSCVRGGRPVVGVVMGGASGAWRDNRMIQLLDQTYATLASRGSSKGVVIRANLPLQKNQLRNAAPVSAAQSIDIDEFDVPMDANEAGAASPSEFERAMREGEGVQHAMPAATVAAVAASKPAPVGAVSPVAPQSPVIVPPVSTAVPRLLKSVDATVVRGSLAPVSPVVASPFAPASPALPSSLPPAATPLVAPPTPVADISARNWGIQVGAFSSKSLASSAAQQSFRLVSNHLQGAKILVLPPEATSEKMFRARLHNITEAQAAKACAILKANHSPCVVWKK